jgi:hypothetical protein
MTRQDSSISKHTVGNRLDAICVPQRYAIAVAAARAPEVSSGKKRDKTDGKPFESV